MLIWGNKTRRKRLGRVADYCEICRKICAFELYEISTEGSKYFERPPRHRLPGAVCETCGTAKPTQLGRYDSYWGDPKIDLDTLIDLTHHNIRKTRSRELDLAARLERGELSEDDRLRLMRDTVMHLETSLIQRAEGVYADGWTITEVLMMGTGITGVMVWLNFSSVESALTEVQWFVVMGVIALARLGWLLLTEDYRYAKRQLQPRLVASLAPLKPSYEELRDLLTQLDRENFRVGDRLSPRSIHRDLQRLKRK